MRQRHECLVEHWRDIRRIHPTGANVRFIARRFGRAPAPSTATGIPKSLEPENGDVAGDVPSYPGSPPKFMAKPAAARISMLLRR